MRGAALLAFLAVLITAQEAAWADTFRLRSGETKRGKVLAEDEESVLLDPGFNRPLVEIPKKNISIQDREPGADIKLGGVSFYSTSPKKKKAKRSEPPAGPFTRTEPRFDPSKEEEDDAAEEKSGSVTLDMLEALFKKHMEKNPEMEEWLEKAAQRAVKQSAQLDELVEQAKS